MESAQSLEETMSETDPATPKEPCPFDPDRPRGEDCPWGDECPWFVDEGQADCFCSVGVTPEMQLAKQLAAKAKKDQ